MPEFKINPKSFYENPDEKLEKKACIVPFKHIEIHAGGQISACCHTWLPQWVGNILLDSTEDVIKNANRVLIQENMKQGRFDNCNDQCPQLNSLLSGEKNYWDIVPIKKLNEKLEKATMNVGFSYDLSCNLQCPSCRNEMIYWDPFDPDDHRGRHIAQIHDKVKELISVLVEEHHIVNLNITGSGDAFASPLYWSYLKELAAGPIPKNLRINLKTNGVLMTEKHWQEIEPLWNYINYVEVSVDAFTEETYKIVRKNGNFKKLKNNLECFDQMVYNGCFGNLSGWQTNFIVQKDNFNELKDYTEWQLSYISEPVIWTNLLAQWHHIPDDKFKVMAIWQEDHIDRDKLIEILKDPIFLHPRIKLGNMTSLLPAL
jgi:pyruvate-formate lyase-activating enzyme